METAPIITGKKVPISTRGVAIEDGYIVWRTDENNRRGKALEPYKPVGSELLDEFIFLADKPPDLLLRFARRYGPLGLCKHGCAIGHRKSDFNTRCYELAYGTEDIARGVRARESVEAWGRYIARADGMLIVAGKLHEREKTTDQDWSWLYDVIPQPEHDLARRWDKATAQLRFFGAREARPYVALLTANKASPLAACPLYAVLAAHKRDTPNRQKQALSGAVNFWLDECETGLCLSWPASGIELTLGVADPLGRGNRLLVAIGAQLIHAISQKSGYVRCYYCTRSFKPFRKPREPERPCCGDAPCLARASRMRQSEFKLRQSTNKGRKKGA